MNKNDDLLKVKIAVTILMIATIDLRGEVDADQIVGLSNRLWLMLGLFCGLAMTATVLIAVVRLTSGSKES